MVPVRYDWLRLSLQDPAKLIDEESELATIAAFTDID